VRLPTPVARLAVVVALASCGGAPAQGPRFSTDWQDDGGASIERIRQRIATSSPPPAADGRVASAPFGHAADVVVGVSRASDEIIGLPLARGASRWTFAHALDTRPVVAGTLVFGSGGGELFALDAASGRVVWKRPAAGLTLVGAGDDGAASALVLHRNGGLGSALWAVARDGVLRQVVETEQALGAPAVVAGLAFVPWASQYVSVIDLSSGGEVARVTLREQVQRAWTQAGALWFGDRTFVRFDANIREASKGGASKAALPQRELPGTPALTLAPAPLSVSANALDKVRLYARPAATDAGAAIADGRWYATYFRLAMGFVASDGKLAWVHVHDTNLLGGAAAEGALVLCDEAGAVTQLDANTGAVLLSAQLGAPLRSCVANADAFHPPSLQGESQPLTRQLEEAVRVRDAELATAQALLLRELAAMTDASATQTLIDLASDPRTSPALVDGAREALAKRRSGADAMKAALARHVDFLKDVLLPPPVGPMARALGEMRDRSAAPLLAAHLLDPNDRPEDIRDVAVALTAVAGPDEIGALRQFLAMYRANAEDDDMAEAVVSVAHALVALGGKPARAEIDALVQDPMTVAYVREHLSTSSP
jgi:outer membrane protein assembly factor BamB